MAEFKGNLMYVTFAGTQISSRYRNFESNEEVGLVDKSAGADAARTYLVTLEDGTATLEMLAEAGGTPLWTAVKKGAEGTLIWGEEGTVAGKPKHTVNAIVKSRRRAVVYEDVVKITVEFQFSGAVVDATY